MARSILGTITLAVTVAFAVPVALTGANLLLSGDHLVGAGLVGVAVLMIAFEEYLVTPWDVPTTAAQRVVGAALPDESELDEE